MGSVQDQGVQRAKAEAFLWAVQAGLLAAAANVRRADRELDPTKVAAYSGTGVFIRIDEAVRAAGRIPDGMTPATAAAEFCRFWAEAGTSRSVPYWFARYGSENHDYSVVGKVEQFLWTVQTAVLADAEHQAHRDARGKSPKLYDPDGIVQIMAKAAEVAGRMPDNLDATRAASDFLAHYVPGMREKKAPPKWCQDAAPALSDEAS